MGRTVTACCGLILLVTTLQAADTDRGDSSENALASTPPPYACVEIEWAPVDSFRYRMPWTASIMTDADRAQLSPDNLIRVSLFAQLGGNWHDDTAALAGRAGFMYYNEGGIGVGDVALRGELGRLVWQDADRSRDALGARFELSLFKPLFETPTWQSLRPDTMLVFRTGPVLTGGYQVRLDNRRSDDDNSLFDGRLHWRFASGPWTFFDAGLARQTGSSGWDWQGDLRFPLMGLSPRLRLDVLAAARGPLDRDRSAEDRFSAGFEIVFGR